LASYFFLVPTSFPSKIQATAWILVAKNTELNSVAHSYVAKLEFGLVGREELWFFTAINANSRHLELVPSTMNNPSSSQSSVVFFFGSCKFVARAVAELELCYNLFNRVRSYGRALPKFKLNDFFFFFLIFFHNRCYKNPSYISNSHSKKGQA
jgi:hypothetical protein